jgi:small subunit ribosomal protein S2
MRKKMGKLEANLRGIKNMPGVPQVMFVIDAKKEAIAVREAERMGIPCIGVVDTNCDPDVVPIPVPGNDDAIRAVQLFCSVMAEAVMEGRMRAEKYFSDQEQRRGKEQVQEPVAADEEVPAEEEEPADEDDAASAYEEQ